jgi:hypothetical protein
LVIRANLKKLQSRGFWARLAIAAIAICLVACSAILGLTDPTLDNTVGDGGGSGDGSAGDGQVADGGKGNDGGDAAPTCPAGDDFTTDKNNCGTCGHDCLGGLCVASKCQAVILASNQDSPFGIAVDSTNVYWTNYSLSGDDDAGTVAACPIGGCPNPNAPTILVAPAHHPIGVASVDGNLYWTASGTDAAGYIDGNIGSCKLPGCTPQSLSPKNLNSPAGITAQGTFVYFSVEGTSAADNTNGGIYRADAPALSNLTQIAFNQNDPTNVSTNSLGVYWAYSDDNGGTVSGVARCPLTGACGDAGVIQLAGADEPFGISLNTQNVFWTEFTDGTIRETGIDGGAASTVAPGIVKPFAVVSDATYVYIVSAGTDPNNDSADGKILRCSVGGCASADVLIDQQDWPHAIAMDEKAIYWANFYGGQIMKLAK